MSEEKRACDPYRRSNCISCIAVGTFVAGNSQSQPCLYTRSHRMPLPGAHSRVHVWPDVWPTESHEPWMAMKRVLGPQQGATRCSQSIRKWPSPLSLPRLVHGKLPSSLAPLPRSFPPPWAAQSGQSPAQCEFQTARPASQCPVPSAQCLLARCSPHHPFTAGCRPISPAVGWPPGTYPLLLQPSPPTPPV